MNLQREPHSRQLRTGSASGAGRRLLYRRNGHVTETSEGRHGSLQVQLSADYPVQVSLYTAHSVQVQPSTAHSVHVAVMPTARK